MTEAIDHAPIGADGKPCRVCGGFSKAFERSTKTRASASASQSSASTTSAIPTVEAQQKAAEATPLGARFGCPESVDSLGRGSWSFLHTVAAYYPEKPSHDDQSEMHGFMRALGRFYPCNMCATHLQYVMLSYTASLID